MDIGIVSGTVQVNRIREGKIMADYQFKYKLGKKYLTLSGKVVTIVATKRSNRGYETVLGDDGIHRYDREGKWENGRVTGTPCYPPDPNNFVDGAWLANSMEVYNVMHPLLKCSNVKERDAIKEACLKLDHYFTIIKIVEQPQT